MQIITVINAKGGCGKSTIAMSLASGLAAIGFETILFDMDPQAQITQWLGLGDGLSPEGTIVESLDGTRKLDELIQPTQFPHLSFVASAQGLEELGRQITDRENYATLFTGQLALMKKAVDFVVIDSPNQISPIMENVIYPTDVFVVPFESTKAVRSYANFYLLLMRLRPGEDHRVLHVLSNLSRQRGLRQRVIQTMTAHGLAMAKTEVRTCGWLAQVDENGGNIFHYRPHSIGASDMELLVKEVLETLGHGFGLGNVTQSPDTVRENHREMPDRGSLFSMVTGNEHNPVIEDHHPLAGAGDDIAGHTASDVRTADGGISDKHSQQHEAA